MSGSGIVLFVLICGAIWAVIAWLHRRDRRRDELRQQLREMEQAIWLESLPDWQREVIEETARQQAAIRQEARRRLGLPEEETPPC